MIVNGYGRYSGYGSTSPSGANCPAGGDWGQWCGCMFPSGELNAKCNSWRPFAPWTVVGAGLRGIPQTGTSSAGSLLDTVTSLVGGQQQTPVPMAPSDDGIFGLPKTIALIGGAVLLLGVGSYVVSKRRKVRR